MFVALFLLIFFTLSSISLTSQSATFDEVQYFGIGKYILKNQKWDVMGAILHPPLSYYINSIPLLFVNENKRLWEYEETDRNLDFLGAVDVYRGQELLSSVDNRNDRLLISSRLLFVALGLLLGYYIYRFSSALYGKQGGLLSLFFFVFCPNMLAYSGLIVPDMPLTAFSFISVYYLWVCLKNDNVRNRLLAGFSLGLALLSKFTALLLLPCVPVLSAAFMIRERKNYLVRAAFIIAVAVLVLFLGYGFDILPYFQGIKYQLTHANDGHSSFLMGKYSIHGWWYYYVVVFLLKTPIPVLLLFIMALVIYFIKPRTNRIDSLFLLLPIMVIFVFFSIEHQSIGIRYILPIYPFIFAFIGSLRITGKRYRYCLCVLAAWYVGTSLYIAPHYLAYFNEFIGGPENGYKYLVDSNLDWGQDLKGLKKFMDRHGVRRISLSYFGADSPQRYGIKYDWLPSHHLYNPAPGKKVSIPPGQLIAVSATNLQGVYLENNDLFKWLLQYQPVAKIGYSMFIYDIKKPPIESVFK